MSILQYQLILLQKDDPTLNRTCILPPNCLSLDKLCERATKRASNKTTTKATLGPAIHVHNHFANPVNPDGIRPTPSHRSKRARSPTPDSSDVSTDSESLPLTEVLADLNTKYPKLHFDQYEAILEEHGIVYVESVSEFMKGFFVGLGMAEGAVGPFLKGTRKALLREKRDRKLARVDHKENEISRLESVEL